MKGAEIGDVPLESKHNEGRRAVTNHRPPRRLKRTVTHFVGRVAALQISARGSCTDTLSATNQDQQMIIYLTRFRW
jgi:hypothetical protein